MTVFRQMEEMMLFKWKVIGVDRETARRRWKTVWSDTDKDAISQANDAGILVASCARMPEEPATDAQVKYATAHGIPIPDGIGKESLSKLISMHVNGDFAGKYLITLRLAVRRRMLAEILYYSPAAYACTRRRIEPYELQVPKREYLRINRQGSAVMNPKRTMVWCWQREPEPGYRRVRLDRFRSVTITTVQIKLKHEATILSDYVELWDGSFD